MNFIICELIHNLIQRMSGKKKKEFLKHKKAEKKERTLKKGEIKEEDERGEEDTPKLTISIGKEGKIREKSTVYAKEKDDNIILRKQEGSKGIEFVNRYPYSSEIINHKDLILNDIAFPLRPNYSDLVNKEGEISDGGGEEEGKDKIMEGEKRKLNKFLSSTNRYISILLLYYYYPFVICIV